MHVCCALFVLAELLSIAQGPGAPKTLVTKVLHEGDPAPGVPGASIAFMAPPQIDAAANVSIWARLKGAGIDPSNDHLIYFGPPGNLEIVTRETWPAPDLPGVTIGNLLQAWEMLSEDGWIAYCADLKGAVTPGVNDAAAFVGPPGDIRLLARAGDPAPGLEPGVVLAKKPFHDFRVRLSDSHTILLRTALAGAGVDDTNNEALFVGTRDELKLLWRKGMPAPGTEPGVTFSFADLEVFNDSEQIAFRGQLVGPGIDETNDRGLWLGGPGALTLIARDGDSVPGFPEGVAYNTAILGLPTINAWSDTSAVARLQGTGITPDNDDILYVGGAYPFQFLVHAGDAALEAGAGVEIDGIGNSLVNARGEIFYRVRFRGDSIDDTNRWAMYLGPYDDTQLSLRDADSAPFLPAGTVLSRVVAVPALAAMNDEGDIIATTEISGGDITEGNDVVLWLRAGASGKWLPVLRSGTALGGRVVSAEGESDMGDNYQNKTGGSDGQAQSLNDAAQLTMKIEFSDGTVGLYTLELVWPADLNCDGAVNAFDIDPFVLALTDPSGYGAKYAECSVELADLNADGKVDAFDIDPFVHLLVTIP